MTPPLTTFLDNAERIARKSSDACYTHPTTTLKLVRLVRVLLNQRNQNLIMLDYLTDAEREHITKEDNAQLETILKGSTNEA